MHEDYNERENSADRDVRRSRFLMWVMAFGGGRGLVATWRSSGGTERMPARVPSEDQVMDEPSKGFPWKPEHLRLAIEAAGVALWSWNVDTDELTKDERAFALWNVTHCETVTFEDLSAHIHPADRDRVRAAFAATRA